ncbi:MAG: ABC transporter ATP-binding protein [Caldilineaceae bacterium]
MSEHDIVLTGVSKQYGAVTAVDNISLSVDPGTYCCLLGPSGCGKTSTLRMIAGHEVVSSGQIRIRNQDVTHLAPARRNTAMMFQNYALFPHMTVLDNVAFGLKMRGVGKKARRQQALDMLTKIGLAELGERYPAQLSGGQQQRVALGRALITEPAVLLLDEPLSALDRFVRVRMRGELRRIQKQLGITFVHVTHSQEEALALADLVVVMEGGRIEQSGSPREIYDGAQTPFVATFIGDHNVIGGKVIEQNAQMLTINGKTGRRFLVPGIAEVGEQVTFAVRADHAFLVWPEGEEQPVQQSADAAPVGTAEITDALPVNVLSGVAAVVEYAGYQVRIKLETLSGLEFTLYVPEKVFSQRPVQLNQPLQVGWHSTDATLLANI